ncbi:MAG: XrtA system polysaccharide chain length determinant [Pseudomonadota bacterium]
MATMEPNAGLRDAFDLIESHLRGMWRYRWRALFVAWALALVGWFFVYTMPDVYEARARIYVDTENAIRPLVENIAPTRNVLNEVNIVTREMLSRPNLGKVARETDLDLRAKTEQDFDNLLTSLQKRINVSGTRENIYSISFEDSDREKAVAVVASLVRTFVEDSLVADRTESGAAQEFLEEKIEEYEGRLTEAEDRLANFKRENVAFMPNQQGDFFSRLQNAQSNLTDTESRLRLALERQAELRRQIEGEVPVFGTVTREPLTSSGGGFAGGKIAELEAELAELRLRYTDKHPRVGQILQTIELLREEQAAAAANIDPATAIAQADPLDRNPVYQNMKIQLATVDVEIVELRGLTSQYRGEVNRLRRQVDTIPQVEAELGRLNRDYDIVKTKYEQFVQQLEAANIGDDIDATIEEVQFRVIDPPFSAQAPVGPPRLIMATVALVAALGASVVVALIFDLLNPVFFTGKSITSLTGVPVLGAVGLVQNEATIKRKRLEKLVLGAAAACLLAAFAVVLKFADSGPQIVQSIMARG